MRFLTSALATMALLGSFTTIDAINDKRYRLDITGDNTFEVRLAKFGQSGNTQLTSDDGYDNKGDVVQHGWNTPATYYLNLGTSDILSVYVQNEVGTTSNGNTQVNGNPSAIVARLREVDAQGNIVPGGFDIPTDDTPGRWKCAYRIESDPAHIGYEPARLTGDADNWANADFKINLDYPLLGVGPLQQHGSTGAGTTFVTPIAISRLDSNNIWAVTNIDGNTNPGVTAITGPLGVNQGSSTPYWIYPINQLEHNAITHHGWCRFEVPGPGNAPTSPPSGGNGDPVFSGFQGQEFQFHGLPDEHFNLVSSPQVQLNAHFVYLSSGKCDYNNTACWTHPGTYMDVLGFSIGEARVKLVAGSHADGLRLWVNDAEVPRHTTIKSLSGNVTASLHYGRNGHVKISTDLIDYEVINSDMFFNFNAALKSAELLTTGAKRHTVTDSSICATNAETHNHQLIESTVSKKYHITTPLHGLVGQTWRNVKVCGRDWMGTVQDYVTESLFGTTYHYNYFKF